MCFGNSDYYTLSDEANNKTVAKVNTILYVINYTCIPT